MEFIKQNTQGSLIIISGPGGAGKGSVIKGLLKKNPNCWLSISTTSRNIRPDDIEGVTYNFTTKEDFEKKIEEGFFLEYEMFGGNYYGTPKTNIEEKLHSGIDVILEIEIYGANNVKKMFPNAICIFIMPPSIEILKERLEARKTDSKERILERFQIAYKEINEVTEYNYVVVNDILEEAINKVDSIVTAEKCSVDRIEEVFLNSKEEFMHEVLLTDKEFENIPLTIE